MSESVWSPLKIPVYRSFWICAFLSNMGTWIQDVAAGWAMTHLSTSPLVIALLAFTNSFPVVFLSLPAGYISDLGYRRRILLAAQAIMFLSAAVLAYLVISGKVTEVSLLTLSLFMGVGFALTNPAFQSVLTDLVPPPLQTKAVLVYYIGVNITRVVGPSLGGGLLSGVGQCSAFVVNSLSFLGLIFFFWKWPVPQGIIEKEKIQIVREDWKPIISWYNMKLWIEIFFVTFFASSLWALYPTRGRLELQLNSWQYGSLLGYLGLGACVSAFFSERVMHPRRTRMSLAGSYLVYAGGVFLLATATHYLQAGAAMFFAGTGWLVLSTLMNMSSRQIIGKSSLKATMLGVFMTVFYAGMSLGSVTWGAFARLTAPSLSLVISSLGLGLIGATKALHSLQE